MRGSVTLNITYHKFENSGLFIMTLIGSVLRSISASLKIIPQNNLKKVFYQYDFNMYHVE